MMNLFKRIALVVVVMAGCALLSLTIMLVLEDEGAIDWANDYWQQQRQLRESR